MKLSEIYEIPSADYKGGSDELERFSRSIFFKNRSEAKEFPDNKEFLYAISRQMGRIWIFALEKTTDELIGALSLDEEIEYPIDDKSYNVDSITTHENYRGRGIAQSLYKVALKNPPNGLGITLMSGHAQTPGGKRAWALFAKDPKIDITGFFAIHEAIIEPELYGFGYRYDIDQLLDDLFGKIGAFEIHRHSKYIIYGFPVKFLLSKVVGDIETDLLKMYEKMPKITKGISVKSGMFAQYKD